MGVADKAERQKTAARIGGAIRRVRLSHRLTQMELASRVGISYQQLQKYEYGSCEITVPRLAQIAKALQVPVGLFVNGSNESFDDLPQSPEEVRVLRLYRGLENVKLKRLAEHMLGVLANSVRGR